MLEVAVTAQARTSRLDSVTGLLAEADDRLRAGENASAAVWPTGFTALDRTLAGGLRAGELVLLAGPQGLGKTTLALQTLRNVVASGGAGVYFSFEHDPHGLLERLIAMEAAVSVGSTAVPLRQVRDAFVANGVRVSLRDRLGGAPGGLEALAALDSYGERLLIHRSNGGDTSVSTVRQVVEDIHARTGERPLVVVDYLQKVQAAGSQMVEDERVTTVVEGLKDLALELALPVLAIVAADKDGIAAGKRMRVQNLRGSSALAYEADIVLIMNDKYDVVARHHLVYDVGNAERFRSWVVVSIEKNRNGVDRVDVEFCKRFQHSLFEADGRPVTEQLVDERVFVE